MKKIKLLVASLLLLTSVGVLASCDTNSSSTSSEETPVVIVDGINVRVPDHDIVVGDVINLDDYVTFLSAGNIVQKDYEAILTTPTTATLSGHTLTVKAEGNINVRINVDEESGRFNVDAISSMKSKFKSVTSNAGKNYYVDNITVVNGELTLSNKGFLHNNNYFAYCLDSALFPGEDLGELANTWMGLMKNFYGDTYNFTMDNLDGDNLEVLPGIQLGLSNYYFNDDFPLSHLNFQTKGEDTLITTSTKVADQWINYALANVYTPKELGFTNYGLVANFEDVKTTKGEVVEALIISVFVYNFTDGTKEYTLDNPYYYITNAVLFEKEFYSVPTLNTYIGNRRAPTPLSHADIVNAFSEFTATKTYTMENSLYYTNYDGKNIADPLNGNLPVETYNTYFNENGWITEFTNGQVLGLVSQNNKLYEVSNVDKNNNLLPHPETEEYPEGNFSSSDIWGGELDHYLTSIFSSEIPYSPVNILSNEVEGDTRVITIGSIGSDYFLVYSFNVIQGYGAGLYEILADDSEGYPLLLYCTTYVTITPNDITIDVQLDLGENIIYHMQSKFFDNGIDKLTERISSLSFN